MLRPPWKIDQLSGFEACDAGQWSRLLAASRTRSVFLSLPWQATWWSVFGRGQLLLFQLSASGIPVAFAPLFADSGMVFFVGSGGSDYLDFVGNIAEADILVLLLQAARESTPDFVGFRFYHVPDSSSTGSLLAAAAEQLEMACFDEGDLPAPLLKFADWPAGTRSPADKKSLVRHERQLEKKGLLQVSHLSKTAEVLPCLREFFLQHIRRWETTPYPSLFLDKKQRDFYTRLAIAAGDSDWFRFTRIAVNDRAVAYHFGSNFQGTYLWYKPTFDVAWASDSPGEVLLRQLLLAAQAEGAHSFDFGLGDEKFKERFATVTNHVRTWGIYPR